MKGEEIGENEMQKKKVGPNSTSKLQVRYNHDPLLPFQWAESVTTHKQHGEKLKTAKKVAKKVGMKI